MNSECSEALATARRLIRTLDAAPDPLRQAQTAVAGLIRVRSWAPDRERAILALAEWLAQRPPVSALKGRCQAVLKALS